MRKKKTFRRGDRIYASVMLGGRQLAECVFDCIDGMTELICAMRYRVREYRGLAKIFVRNITSGWSLEQPLMLYEASTPSHSSGNVSVSDTSEATTVSHDRFRQWMEL